MGEKNILWNQLLKAKKAGDLEEVARLEAEIEAFKLAKAEERTGRKQYPKKKTYNVVSGDNWFSIAEEIYGDQRYAGLLMDANPGIEILQPGMVLETPNFAVPPGQTPFFSYQTWGRVLKQNEALRAAGANPSGARIGDYTPQDLANFFPDQDDFEWAIDIWAQENQLGQQNVPLMDGMFTPEDILNALLDPALWEEMGEEVGGTGAGEQPLLDGEQTPEEVEEEALAEEPPISLVGTEGEGDEGEGPPPEDQTEALETLEDWYNETLANYNLLNETNPDISIDLLTANLDYTYSVYQDAIQLGVMGLEEVNMLISGESPILAAQYYEPGNSPRFDMPKGLSYTEWSKLTYEQQKAIYELATKGMMLFGRDLWDIMSLERKASLVEGLLNYDPKTGPDLSEPIADWGNVEGETSDEVEAWRRARAMLVMYWLYNLEDYEGETYWKGDQPTEQELAAWLFWEEGGAELPEAGAKLMADIIRWQLQKGITPENMTFFTAFINPTSGGSFDQEDWQELVNPLDSQGVSISPFLDDYLNNYILPAYAKENFKTPLYIYWATSEEFPIGLNVKNLTRLYPNLFPEGSFVVYSIGELLFVFVQNINQHKCLTNQGCIEPNSDSPQAW